MIPSYRRPHDLARCLEAVRQQARQADEVLVVVRAEDEETAAVVSLWRGCMALDVVEVTQPGQVHALNAGLARCTSDIVSITDDDAAPRPDWLARIEAHFAADPGLGGVGGRDWVHQDGRTETGQRRLVGRISWFGRVAGNHHLGAGPAREVDVLKGVNFSFRTAPIREIGFATGLRGDGAQVHCDMQICFAMRRAGWRLLYDPEVAVDHFPGLRDGRARDRLARPETSFDMAYNYQMAIAAVGDGWRRLMMRLWSAAIGTRAVPGLAWAAGLLCLRGAYAFSLWRAARAGAKAARRQQRHPAAG